MKLPLVTIAYVMSLQAAAVLQTSNQPAEWYHVDMEALILQPFYLRISLFSCPKLFVYATNLHVPYFSCITSQICELQ